MSLEALKELAAKVEAGDNDFDPSSAFHMAMGGKDYEWIGKTPGGLESGRAYSGSLDAAKALHDAVLPGWVVGSISQEDGGFWHFELRRGFKTSYDNVRSARLEDLARSWLLSILFALIAQEESK